MKAEHLLAEVEDILRTMPQGETLNLNTPENLSWIGRAAAFIKIWDLAESIAFRSALNDLRNGWHLSAFTQIQIVLRQAQSDLRLKTIGPINMAIGQGLTFDYFDAVRKTMETARSDLFFIDRYLDAEFVSRYLPHVASGVSIRLLARDKITVLLPAVEAFARQSGTKVQIRSSTDFHDRYVIVDRQACYQSGASFKDGARAAPTTLTQITDAFQAVHQTYETLWASAKVER
jgi:hypothetical protein